MSAVFKREFRAYFTSPIGYIVLAIFFLFSGLYFDIIFSNSYAYIASVFMNMVLIVMFVVPILTMRLFSEERRQKTDQALFTAPIKLHSVVLGKFFAAMALFGLGFSMTVIFQFILMVYADVNWLLFFNNLIGMALVGASMISIGIFLSSLTESSVLAAILGIVVSFLLMLVDSFANQVSVEWIRNILVQFSFSARFNTFASGTFDFTNVVFFLSVTFVFLFLTVRMLEKKRWA